MAKVNIQRCAESAPDYTIAQLVNMAGFVEHVAAMDPISPLERALVDWAKRLIGAPPVEAQVMGYYTAATNQDGELDVKFYATSQECDAALDALEQKQRDRDILGYTGGRI